jgi:hypothetical protein
MIFRFILSDHLNTYETRSEAIAKVLNDMRARDCLRTLRGWRDEVNINDIILTENNHFFVMQLYLVKSAYHNPPLFSIERAAASKKHSFSI